MCIDLEFKRSEKSDVAEDKSEKEFVDKVKI